MILRALISWIESCSSDIPLFSIAQDFWTSCRSCELPTCIWWLTTLLLPWLVGPIVDKPNGVFTAYGSLGLLLRSLRTQNAWGMSAPIYRPPSFERCSSHGRDCKCFHLLRSFFLGLGKTLRCNRYFGDWQEIKVHFLPFTFTFNKELKFKTLPLLIAINCGGLLIYPFPSCSKFFLKLWEDRLASDGWSSRAMKVLTWLLSCAVAITGRILR